MSAPVIHTPPVFEPSDGAIVWMPEFDTGIPEIDRQHRTIVQIINEVSREARSAKAMDVLFDSCDRLVDYILMHFSFEENLMRMAGYTSDKLSDHESSHTKFASDLNGRFKALSLCPPDQIADHARGFASWLKTWLYDHILKVDKDYVPTVFSAQRAGVI